MPRLQGLLAACLLAPLALASPHLISADVGSRPKVEVVVDRAGIRRDSLLFSRDPGAPMVRRNGLAARTDSKSFSFDQTLENQLLFNSSDIPLFPGPSIAVVCAKCCSSGSVEATFPSDLTDIVNPKFRVDLRDIEVFVEVDVVVAGGNTFQIPLLPLLPGITNLQFPGFRGGLFVDLLLVFQISAEVDLRGGFYVKIPEGSFFEIDIDDEGFTSQDFDGIVAKPLPVIVNNDDTGVDVKVDLRLMAELSISATTDVDIPIPGLDKALDALPGIGAGAGVGAFVNLIEYVANVGPEDDCALEASQELNLNIGAFATVGVSLGDEFLGLKPSATTTLFTIPLPSTCLLGAGEAVPTRTVSLEKAAGCGAAQPEGGQVDPGVVRREEGEVVTITAVACQSALADCPEDLRTTVTYESTLCPPSPEVTCNCVAVTDASKMEPTSVVVTAEAGTATADAIQGWDHTGAGTGSVPHTTKPCATQPAKGPDHSSTDDLYSEALPTTAPLLSSDLTTSSSSLTPSSSDLPVSSAGGSDVSVILGTGSSLPSVDFTIISGSPVPEPTSTSPDDSPVQAGGSKIAGGALVSAVAVMAIWLLI
ncbi:uncharacterized protein DNG_05982 [Cephalotrichum gorgonifer]|uniref:Uncharacterized protein n=1 Tax=Cephalotrichum gorgonifer TaxID=2041049 RepID=A0AAE8SW19_9PEZI|nr:uncharacterized protein DNG_05982 [Cephalotrichum gorgonifer]